jgi:hypothetical protein
MSHQKRNYNAENKSRVRQVIVDEIRKRDIKSIVTLESPEFLFSKLLPDKKILVFEKDGTICEKLEKKAPKNVEVVFGNVNRLEIFNGKWDMIYLDFCGTWLSEQENIIKLKEELSKVKLFGLTICMRTCGDVGKIKEIFKGDYQFDILKKLQDLTKINWKVVYGESYTDSVQMMTLLLENTNVGG